MPMSRSSLLRRRGLQPNAPLWTARRVDLSRDDQSDLDPAFDRARRHAELMRGFVHRQPALAGDMARDRLNFDCHTVGRPKNLLNALRQPIVPDMPGGGDAESNRRRTDLNYARRDAPRLVRQLLTEPLDRCEPPNIAQRQHPACDTVAVTEQCRDSEACLAGRAILAIQGLREEVLER